MADPVILFGAFDRHNLGDLLLAHVAAADAAPRPVVFAGLAERDLTPHGGHRVAAITRLARTWGDRPARVVHVGGELLTCTLYQAAVMLLEPAAARAAIARHDGDPDGGRAWARDSLGLDRQIAYLVPRALFAHPARCLHLGIGGADLDRLPAAARREALDALRHSGWLGVRERTTRAHLARHGIAAMLVPDPAVRVGELFAARIAGHGGRGEPARVRDRFPAGYLAVQFSADFGDDATLARLAAQLDRIVAATGLAVVLFRAGAAPWHDDAEPYRRLAARLATRTVHHFESLDIWDICALLAGAAAFCGSSLHGRIVAAAHGRPAVSLVADPAAGKLVAYARTWYETEGDIGCATVDGLAATLGTAMRARPAGLRGRAAESADAARRAAADWLAALDAPVV